MLARDTLLRYLDTLLEAARFRDYSPNGLQVEGCAAVRRVVTGVTASAALIEAAIARGADTLLVHHGWFWKGEDGRITGIRRQRIARLLAHNINLMAYHLPLDAHPLLGNNAGLARALGWQAEGRFGEQDIGWWGVSQTPTSVGLLAADLARCLGRTPLCIAGDSALQVPPAARLRPLRLAWCSGGAQSYFEQAIALGVDAYISGEISEPTVHLARETGVAYLAAGHHATERFGPQALAAHLTQHYADQGLVCEFVDIDNPV